jgi:hypothetical protein
MVSGRKKVADMQRAILVAAVPFVSAFLGSILAFRLLLPSMVEAQEARIRAEQVIVVGDNGAERIRLSTGPGIIGALGVFSPDGATARVTIATGGLPTLGGRVPESAGLNVFADDGTQLVRLGTSGRPGQFEPGSNLVLHDAQGHPRIIELVDANGSPSILFLDADGNVTWSAP